MYVTEIVQLDKKKSKVIFDSGECIALYRGEIRRLDIQCESEVSEDRISEIFENILPKRCKERAMYIIERSDKSEKEITRKLKEGLYPDNVIDKTISFLKKYGYIDDRRYAENYINSRKKRKSRRQIEFELNQKGIGRDLVQEVYQEVGEDSLMVIHCILNSKRYDELSEERQRKQIASLLRKGFNYDDIVTAINNFQSK